jgi:hypothetical protein
MKWIFQSSLIFLLFFVLAVSALTPSALAQQVSGAMDWSPFLRQTVKTHFSSNGELSHGIVTQAVHAGG